MTEEPPTPKRPKRWLAFLLNLIFPPAGYVYAGMPRWAFGYVAILILVTVGLMVWTMNAPPGLYGLGLETSGAFAAWEVTLVIRMVAAVHAAWRPRSRTFVRGVAAWVLAIGLIMVPLGAGFGLRLVIPYRFYDVLSGSMLPNLRPGDVMLVKGNHGSCRTPELKAGMVVTQKKNGVIFVWRLLAGPGQAIEMKAGRVIIDGQPVKTELLRRDEEAQADILRETLPNGASYLVLDLGPRSLDDFAPVTVPEGRWFLLGDNRDNALDSRFDGPARASDICGRAIKIISSKDKAAIGRPL